MLEPNNGEPLDLGVVVLEEDITSEQQLSLVTITEKNEFRTTTVDLKVLLGFYKLLETHPSTSCSI